MRTAPTEIVADNATNDLLLKLELSSSQLAGQIVACVFVD
jgi:hypothetical protein